MAITIDWGTRIISVPKADMTLLQSNPTEIRELDLNAFRLVLRALEASPTGMPYQITHNHVAPINVGGITLARVIEIINGYTVTFEDDQYAVNITGGNSNVGDNVNVNQVSVRTFNSAGLVTSVGIESIEYQNKVTVNSIDGEIGSVYPIGTYRRPVNNVEPDGFLIAINRGFSRFDFIKSFTFNGADNLDEFELWGEAPTKTDLNFPTGVSTKRTEIYNAYVDGDIGGAITVGACNIGTLIEIGSTTDQTNFKECLFENVLPNNSVTFLSSGTDSVNFIDCYSGIAGVERPIFDVNGTAADIVWRNYSGGMTIKGATGGNFMSVDFESGTVEFDATCTNGLAVVRGDGIVIDNSGIGFTVYDFSTATLVLSGNADITTILQTVQKLSEYTVNKLTIDVTRAPEIYLQIWNNAGDTITYEHRLRTTTGTDPTVDDTAISSRDGDSL